MPEQYHRKLIEQDEAIIFDKRHSLWEIWKNFLVGGASIVALVLLLTTFKPSAEPGTGTNWGYIALISVLALFFLVWYGAWPLFKRRNMPERHVFVPISAMVLSVAGWITLFAFENNQSFINGWTVVVVVAFVVVIAGWLLYPLFAWFFAHFVLTDRRVILSTGIVNKHTMAIPLEQLNDIKTSQNLWERIFKYGDVLMETAGEFGQQPFTNIGHPLEVKKQIFEQRNRYREQQESMRGHGIAREMAAAIQTGAVPAAPVATAGGPGVVERLEKLTEMRAKGDLSDEEFQRAKEELLEMEREETQPGPAAPPPGG